jgi:hypothetical protein
MLTQDSIVLYDYTIYTQTNIECLFVFLNLFFIYAKCDCLRIWSYFREAQLLTNWSTNYAERNLFTVVFNNAKRICSRIQMYSLYILDFDFAGITYNVPRIHELP